MPNAPLRSKVKSKKISSPKKKSNSVLRSKVKSKRINKK